MCRFSSRFLKASAAAWPAYWEMTTLPIQPFAAEDVNQAQNVQIVGDAQIAAYFVLFNVGRADDNDDFRLRGQLSEHAELAVRCKAWQNTGGVVVVKKFSSEFEVEFVVKLVDALLDVFGLHVQVFLVVKTDAVHGGHLSFCQIGMHV